MSQPGIIETGVPDAEARFVAPWTPPERMWGGLARAMMMWLGYERPTPRALFQHLKSCGHEIPKWLTEESEMKSLDHVPSKGTRCVLIYRAMLWDGRSLHLTPSGHTADCEFHCEQYPHECTCGATLSAAQGPEAATTIARLVEALRPFANALDDWGDDPAVGDDATLWEHPMGMCISTGDFRRARALTGEIDRG